MCRIMRWALVCYAVTSSKPDVLWDVLGTVTQSNAWLGLSDRLEVHVEHVGLLAGSGKRAKKTKEPSFDVVSVIKRSIVVVKPVSICLAPALFIAMARVNGDSKYNSYMNRYGLKKTC